MKDNEGEAKKVFLGLRLLGEQKFKKKRRLRRRKSFWYSHGSIKLR